MVQPPEKDDGGPQSPAVPGPAQGDEFLTAPPEVTVPKGGGALSSIGETFQANPVTGTANATIPIALSPGREGGTPQLALSYDSGGGNGPFGLGWSLGVPMISRRTSKGLPRYRDAGDEQDVYVLAGSEDLVPEQAHDSGWSAVTSSEDSSYDIQRYRPRVVTQFTRVERWKRKSDGDIHWRVRTPDNRVMFFGQSSSARLADPDDSKRVFAWYLEKEQTELGHIIVYEYASEDQAGVTKAHPAETQRYGKVAFTYLKRIKYGNVTSGATTGGFLFEVVFDYGEHNASDPLIDDDDNFDWDLREDPYSNFRPGFDQRCYRLCQRVLVYHRISSLSSVARLVRSTEFTYDADPAATRLTSALHRGWVLNGSTWDTDVTPSVSFTYTAAALAPQMGFVDGLAHSGFNVKRYQWVDLDGEGLTGLLTEAGGAWFYKRNEGNGTFAPPRRLTSRPSLGLGAGGRFVDVDGDGQVEVLTTRPSPGFQGRDDAGEWAPRRTFRSWPTHTGPDDPKARLIDLTGDGRPDIVLTGDNVIRYYPGLGEEGYGAEQRAWKVRDEDQAPQLRFSSASESVFTADMTGDGLTDLVRITNGQVCYWPNKGYGKFGPKVILKNSPRFDRVDGFSPSRIRLADLDGTGPTDLIYLGAKCVQLYRNQSGNALEDVEELTRFPPIHNLATVTTADLRGDGTQCLVWSSPLLTDAWRPLRYLQLHANGKPHLLQTINNGMGKVTTLTYAPSTAFYLADRQAGTPWATKLPFPVQCLQTVVSHDQVSGARLTTEYAYHHGYYDGVDRAFRGFGKVEQWDTERFRDYGSEDSLAFDVAPVKTVTWFHTGAFRRGPTLLEAYADEYWADDEDAFTVEAPTFTDEVTSGALSVQERREAVRTLKGRVLRTEVYAEDGEADEDKPYVVTQTSYGVRKLQPGSGSGDDRVPAAFHVFETESITAQYDRYVNENNKLDPRVAQTLALEVDKYGVTTLSAAISYPRRENTTQQDDWESEHGDAIVVVTETDVVHDDEADARYRLSIGTDTSTWELELSGGVTSGTKLTASDFPGTWSSVTEVAPEDTFSSGTEKRLLSKTRTDYWNDGLTGTQDLSSSMPARLLVRQQFQLAITATFNGSGEATDGLLFDIFGTDISETDATDAGYAQVGGDDLWRPSGVTTLDSSHFYQPSKVTDPFGNETELTWDTHRLFVTEVEDPMGNTVTAVIDYRVLAPDKVTEPNGTSTEVAFDELGRVTKMAISDGTSGDTLTSPTAEYTYAQLNWQDNSEPVYAYAKQRETHADSGTVYYESYSYSDGMGQLVQAKVQAEDGMAPERDTNGDLVFVSGVLQWADTGTSGRWVGTGRTVRNNKGLVIHQYEPFFSATSDYETEVDLVEWGVTPTHTYDAIGRRIQTDFPDGTVETIALTPWVQTVLDANDNCTDDGSYDWYEDMDSGTTAQSRAAGLALDHADTPTKTVFDPLGRPFLVQQTLETTTPTIYETRTTLNVRGQPTVVNDALGNDTQTDTYDLLGRSLEMVSADAGTSQVFYGVDNQPVTVFKPGSVRVRRIYDALRRATQVWASEDGGTTERLHELFVYGEALDLTQTNEEDLVDDNNLRTRLYRVYDGAGEVEFVYDFRGRITSETRTLLDDPETEVDWTALNGDDTESDLDSGASADLDSSLSYTNSATYDAMDRLVTRTVPDGTVTTVTYNQAGLLETVESDLDDGTTETWVSSVAYNEKGQRTSIVYGSDVTTDYTYDANTFRLATLVSKFDKGGAGEKKLQDLAYTYDAVGNVVEVTDASEEEVYFNNTVVSPTQKYELDALYRLTKAEGRAHASLSMHGDVPPELRTSIPDTTDGSAIVAYTLTYTYDAVGNITQQKLKHNSTTQWTRDYTYTSGKNKLATTTHPSGTGTESYTHNSRGAMTVMPNIPTITRDFRDQLFSCEHNGSSDEAFYNYDYAGRRVRKVVDNGQNTEERIYLGSDYEVYRKFVSSTLKDVRNTVHILDDQRRIAMAETLTKDNGTDVTTLSTLERYQLGNHLDSACVETDASGGVITYEEYYPYGATSWWATTGTVSQKRWRYTGMERDEETGLQYHHHRYLAPWLGRWTRADPAGFTDGVNRYRYGRNNPSKLHDPTGLEPWSVERAAENWSIYGRTLGGKLTRGRDALAAAILDPKRALDAVQDQWQEMGATGAIADTVETLGKTWVGGMGGMAKQAIQLTASTSDSEAQGHADQLLEYQSASLQTAAAVASGGAGGRLGTALVESTATALVLADGSAVLVGVTAEAGAVLGGGLGGIAVFMAPQGDHDSTDGLETSGGSSNASKATLTAGKNFKSHFGRARAYVQEALGVKIGKLKAGGGDELLGAIGEGIDNGLFASAGRGTLKKGGEVMNIYRGQGLTVVTKQSGEFVTVLKSGEGLDLAIQSVP